MVRNKRKCSKQVLIAALLIWITRYVILQVISVSDSHLDRSSSHVDYMDEGDKDPIDGESLVRADVNGVQALGNSVNKPALNRSVGRILILSIERAGSSFVGEILSRLSDAYYSIDPLYFLQFGISNNTFIQDFLLGKNVSHYLENLLRCNFRLTIDASAKYFPKENRSRADLLKKVFPNTDTLEEATSTCAQKSKTITKVTNVRYIKDVMSLLNDPLTTLVYVVRDPRGIMNSIIKADNVNHHGELYYNQTSNLQQKIKSICDPMLANLNHLKTSYFKKQSAHSHKSLLVLRFEDIAYQPHDMTIKLFRHFSAEPDKTVLNWLVNTTTSSAYSRNPYSTVRNSSSVPEAWRDGLTLEQVKVIQGECAHVLWELGYWGAETSSVLQDRRKSLIDKLPKHVPQL